MLQLLGGMSFPNSRMSRPIPLLLLSYLATEFEGEYAQRLALANLFWPNPATHFEVPLSTAAFGITILLERKFLEANNALVFLSSSELKSELLRKSESSNDFEFLLEGVHVELCSIGYLEEVNLERGTNSDHFKVHYLLSPKAMSLWNDESDSGDSKKRNLRVILHKLQNGSDAPLVQKNSKYVRALVDTDTQRFRIALSLGDIKLARELYKGPFLQNVEEWIAETRFVAGHALLNWIERFRAKILKEYQMGLLNAAQQTYKNGEVKVASSYVHEMLKLGGDLELSRAERSVAANLLITGNHPDTKQNLQLLELQRYNIITPLNSRNAAQNLAQLHNLESSLFNSSTPVTVNKKSVKLTGEPLRSKLISFKGRQAELEQLHKTLSNPQYSFVQVLGRGGIGKTSLITKYIEMIKDGSVDGRFDAISYTHIFKSGEVTLNSIVYTLSQLLPEAEANKLENFWQAQSNLEGKLQSLFSRFLGQLKILIVLDGVDSSLNELGQFTTFHSEFGTFVNSILESGHQLTLVTLSRIALDCNMFLAEQVINSAIVNLDSGLSKAESKSLLVALDSEGTLGFREVSDSLYSKIFRSTMGQPRMLEAVVGVLKQNPHLSIKRMVSSDLGELVENPTKTRYQSLNNQQRKLVTVLAVFGRPVEKAAICHVLAEEKIEVGRVLQELVERYVISFTRVREESYYLHDLDQTFLQRGFEELRSKTDAKELNCRAADYYKSNLEPKPWQTIADLNPQLFAIEHLIKAGKIKDAFAELESIDKGFVRGWGQSQRLIRLYELILPKLQGRSVEGYCYNALGVAHNQVGEFDAAIRCFTDALRISSTFKNNVLSETLLGNLGLAHFHSKIPDLASMYFDEAIKRLREEDSRTKLPQYLGFKGLCALETGNLSEASRHLEAAFSASSKAQLSRPEHIWMGSLALVRLKQFRASNQEELLKAAEQLCLKALRFCHRTGFSTGETANLDNLAQIYLAKEQLPTAAALCLNSHLRWVKMNHHYQSNTLTQLLEISELINLSRVVEEFKVDGDEILFEATGIRYDTFTKIPDNLVSGLLSLLDVQKIKVRDNAAIEKFLST